MSKIQVGAEVKSTKFGVGVITSIITKSTGYVTVDYNGIIKKEMAFNLTDINGESMKAKPKYNPSEQALANAKKRGEAFRAENHMAILKENFLDSQIKSGNYNLKNIC